MKTFAIVGFGSRGQMFAKLIAKDKNAKLVAVAEPIKTSRKKALDHGVEQNMCFESAEEFFKKPKLCDAIFLCTQDSQHHAQAIKALSLGYDICLEKPAAVTLEECVDIRDTANRLNRKVMLTHVLRYTPFYQYIKKLIDNGSIGKVVTINQTENIAYWHFALSYVRGPWANTKLSTPAILAKCSHDLDILLWLVGKPCKSVSSYGSLLYYNSENAPKGSSKYCVDCESCVKENCVYNAFEIYPERVKRSVVGGLSEFGSRDITEILSDREHNWGKCVFHSDNDAVDHQVVNMLFKDQVTAHLTMTAFSNECYRYIKVHGTEGEIEGNMDKGILYFTRFGKVTEIIDVSKIQSETDVSLDDGHGGGDYYLYKDFCDYLDGKEQSFTRTSINESIESHIMGFAAEESRVNDGKTVLI